MRKCWLIILLFLPHLMHAQIITTIAGTGVPGFSGDGGPALLAKIYDPGSGAFDAVGNYYFPVFGDRIRMLDVSGNIHTFAGTGIAGFSGDGGPATAAQLNPTVVTIDNNDNVFVADVANQRIRKVDAVTGIITTISGIGTCGTTGDGGPASAAALCGIHGLTVDRIGNVYIGCNNKIRKIDTFGIITTVAGNGTNGYSGDGGLATLATFQTRLAVACDSNNNVYIADRLNFRVRKLDVSTGIITTVVGSGATTYIGDGIPATSASMCPRELTFDRHANMYIADDYNQRVYQVDTDNILHAIAGTGIAGYSGDGIMATSSKLYDPSGVSIDQCGNVYIADNHNNRIRKVTLATPTLDSVTITTTTGDTACAGFPITFVAHVHGGVANYFKWYYGSALIGTSTDSTFTWPTPTTAGTVCCDAYDCSSSSVSDCIPLIFAPLTMPTISITGITSTTVGSTVTVNATISGAGSSYAIRWFKNSALFSTTTIPTFIYTKAAGTDTITARVVPTPTGCYDSTLSAPHIVTVATVAVQPLYATTEGSLTLYPNPAQNILYIALPQTPVGGELSICDLIGKTLLTKEYNTGNLQLDISTLPTGIYLLKATDNTGRKWVAKFNKR